MSTDPGTPNMDSVLFTPFSVGGVEVKNRIVSTAHSNRYTLGGLPTSRYRRYQEEKAKGGVGLITIGGSAVVSRDSAPAFGNITMYRDDVITPLKEIASACQQHGSKVFIQLTHLGRRTGDHDSDWLPTVSSASMREPAHRSYPKAAEAWDLDRIVDDFVSAAQRARAAGIDGIELEHYGHLLDAFASPWHLSRLGPDSQKFAREFPGRVIRAVKKVTGLDMALGIRMSVDELRVDGLEQESAIALLNQYIADGIDFVNVIVGTIESQGKMTDVIPGSGKLSAPFLDIVANVKRTVDIPVIHAAKIDDFATAEYAVQEGKLDLVGMTRANIADPYLVTKVQQGKADQIRPCIGARLCLEAGSTGGMVCLHNPAVGREDILKHEIDRNAENPKNVIIVGAGPAGLEAAHVAAKRGHRVTVLEAAAEPGGQMAMIARLPRKREFGGAVDWRLSQALQHGAEFRFDVYAEETDVLDLSPDTVIIATGGIPRSAADVGIKGGHLIRDTWEAFEASSKQLGHTILFDDEGRYSSLDALEHLANNSERVTYVTPERTLGIDVGTLNFADYQSVFDTHRIDVKLARYVISSERNPDRTFRIELAGESTDVLETLVCDAVYYSGGTWPNDELYTALREHSCNDGRIDIEAFVGAKPQPNTGASGFRLFRVGDAVSSRTIHSAILDAHRIALTI
ncbi:MULTISPECIES: FAD-dependent oxidoreductase [unclassified Brevibacterium]|uniref:oxidoreductase n=2 Tax=Brevibacterium TaxID=1696 RepID=UPI00197AA977|nr:FAD-dependent oxidoreductase [Brevibacterium sp. S22]